MKTKDKDINKAAEKCVKDIMKIEHGKQKRTESQLNYFRRDCVDKVRRRRGYD